MKSKFLLLASMIWVLSETVSIIKNLIIKEPIHPWTIYGLIVMVPVFLITGWKRGFRI